MDMLGLSPEDERRSGGGAATCDEFSINAEEFPEFGDQANLLDSIDFEDLFGDSLPELEMEPADMMGAEFSSSLSEGVMKDLWGKGEEVVSKREDDDEPKKRKYASPSSNERKQKAKKCGKVKVDWTPELHRRFVKAVEELGVDKAVPSRILELMNINCLTRHNVASHLQKYRSHRKRQMYVGEATGVGPRNNNNGWLAPTIGFPRPVAAIPSHDPSYYNRPLHVWGHPKHIPPPFWHSLPPYWQRIPNGTTPATPCSFLPTPTRFGAPPVPGIPQPLPPPPRHHTVYKSSAPGFGHLAGQSTGPCPPIDLHPSKESVDAAIGDVLTKPWLPLPLGLKPPSVDGVMEELHRHGVSEVPPTASCA